MRSVFRFGRLVPARFQSTVSDATDGFTRRAASAPHPSLARDLDEALRAGLREGSDKFDREYGKRISNIPLPEESEKYDALWKVMRALNGCGFSKRAQSKILLGVKKDEWVKNAKALTGNFKDLVSQYSSAVADDLILPIYAEEFQRRRAESIFDMPPDRLAKFEDEFVTGVRLKLADFVKDAVLSNLTPERLAGYANRFDRSLSKICQAKPLSAARMEEFKKSGQEFCPQWHAIFPDQEISGIKFKVLTSDAELSRESDEVRNCIVSFSERCRKGVCHIVSGLSPQGERFSIRFNGCGGSHDITMYEVNGLRNQGVSKEVSEATEILCRRIDGKEIALNLLVGSVNKDYTITDALGFNISDQDSVRQVFAAHRDARVIPKEILGLTKEAEEFCREIGLADFLATTIRGDLILARKPQSEVSNPSHYSPYGHRDVNYLD